MHGTCSSCGEITDILQLQVVEDSIFVAWPFENLRSFAASTSNPSAIFEACAEHSRTEHRCVQTPVGVLRIFDAA